ncbi:hypothetical protein [Roseibium sp. RKSG952]|uniref:hypothetical protein n=1 Tax=Roseibium sp. RKSG952 TaxID=2529384 RepID=UPI0012BC653A|nr:hypothetical protein [Roseibium sp. RKSG952]MTH96928.1 hypothetical protein [Roseibium sp. RKSG952]
MTETPAIGKRRVIYIPGYDLRRPEAPFRQFEEELAAFRKNWNVQGGFSGLALDLEPGRASADWNGEMAWPEGKVTASFSLLGWRDLMKRDFRRPLWVVLAGALRTFGLFALAGGYGKGLRANWPNGLFFLYPAMAVFVFLALAIAPVVTMPLILPGEGGMRAGVTLAASAIWLVVLYALTRIAERWSYVWYLIHDWYAIGRLARNEDPEMTARIGAFAARIIEIADACEPDEELVITAHSSGTFVLVYTLAEVLKRIPGFGAGQGKVTVLTMGSAFGYVGGFGAHRGFGTAVARVAEAPNLDWTDVYGPHDIMCCGRTAPVSTYAPSIARRVSEPRRFSVRIPDRMTTERYRYLRFRFFKLHFCYFFASRRRDLFDFYRLTLGPMPAGQQLRVWAKTPY